MPDDISLLTTSSGPGGLWTLSAPYGLLDGRPGVVDDAVYVPLSGGRLAAVDARDGRVRWCAEGIVDPAPQDLVRVGGTVVVPVLREHGRCGLAALDVATGKVLWTRRKSGLNRVAGAGSAVVLWNDTADDRRRIAGVDAMTGEPLWEEEFDRIWSVIVRGELVILDTGSYRALDARTGEEAWHGSGGRLLGQGGPQDAAVFYSWQTFGKLTRHAARTGEEQAGTRFPRREVESFIHGPVLVDGDRALFSEAFGRLARLYTRTRANQAVQLACVRLGRRHFSTFRGPAVSVGDWIYAVTWRDRLYAADATGARRLRRLKVVAPDGAVLREPREITAGPAHVFIAGNGELAAARDGRVLWVTRTHQWGSDPLPLGTDRVLFQSTDGGRDQLHCADAETGRRIL
ncbi:PQQ-binding-like beta-propeller repeat protein [Streptomyces klenkii]|uniref:outer membrane protein assembly factor BamB family protein n=1 Tax=Streptomyces TaxID=1883 RepID=UPI001892BBC7|nr:PQQ-binding-like beta-propeller repeat protein [Streptomyces sp. NRRL B-1677]